MKRAIGLDFIPESLSFSQLDPNVVGSLTAKDIEPEELERTVLHMLYCLETDQERCVLLFELLRQLGFSIDYRSSAKSMHISWRWFMRVKKKMKERLKDGHSHIAQ